MDVKVGQFWKNVFSSRRVVVFGVTEHSVSYEFGDYLPAAATKHDFHFLFLPEADECDSFDWQPAQTTKWIYATAENWMQHWGKRCRVKDSRTAGWLVDEKRVLVGFDPKTHQPVTKIDNDEPCTWRFAQVEVTA